MIWHYMKQSENSKCIIITKKKECDSLVMGLSIGINPFNHMIADVCRANKASSRIG